MTLGRKVLSAQVGMVVVPAVLITMVALWQADRGLRSVSAQTQTSFDGAIDLGKQALLDGGMADLTHQTQNVYGMCTAQQELLEKTIDSQLKVAHDVLSRTGAISLSDETVSWPAVNQLTNAATDVALPRLLAGGAWLGQNKDPKQPSPVVDDARALTGTTCTIFQRMNPAGDMLRVCTNVLKQDGTRAIGTYIPASNPDGSPNPVVAAVARGEKYTGRAFVVDAWYVSAYEPL